VFLKETADNQKNVFRFLVSEGLAFSLNDLDRLFDLDIPSALTRQSEYFDGESPSRLLKIFTSYFQGQEITIRKVRSQDLETCFKWANDIIVRRQSFDTRDIRFEDHVRWFNGKMKDDKCFFYIFELGGKPIAQIRFDINEGEAILGYLVDSSIRNRGMGITILAKGIETFVSDVRRPLSIIGYVKQSNIASQKSFEKLAFRKEQTSNYPGSLRYIMNYEN
jgi:RimJ/RimL family protein N-acetyltransferase